MPVAGDPIPISIQPVNVCSNHSKRPLYIFRSIARAASTINVRSDGNAHIGIVGVAAVFGLGFANRNSCHSASNKKQRRKCSYER